MTMAKEFSLPFWLHFEYLVVQPCLYKILPHIYFDIIHFFHFFSTHTHIIFFMINYWFCGLVSVILIIQTVDNVQGCCKILHSMTAKPSINVFSTFFLFVNSDSVGSKWCFFFFFFFLLIWENLGSFLLQWWIFIVEQISFWKYRKTKQMSILKMLYKFFNINWAV